MLTDNAEWVILPDPDAFLPYFRETEYSRGYLDLDRSDSSQIYRYFIRAGWAPGQQLWDVQVNANLRFWNDWHMPVIYYFRTPYSVHPPWNGGWQYIPTAEPWKYWIYNRNPSPTDTGRRPHTGMHAYAKWNLEYIVWGPDGPQPILHLPYYRHHCEVAVNWNNVKKGHRIAFRPQKRMALRADDKISRLKGVSIRHHVAIYRNDEEQPIARFFKSSYAQSVAIYPDPDDPNLELDEFETFERLWFDPTDTLWFELNMSASKMSFSLCFETDVSTDTPPE